MAWLAAGGSGANSAALAGLRSRSFGSSCTSCASAQSTGTASSLMGVSSTTVWVTSTLALASAKRTEAAPSKHRLINQSATRSPRALEQNTAESPAATWAASIPNRRPRLLPQLQAQPKERPVQVRAWTAESTAAPRRSEPRPEPRTLGRRPARLRTARGVCARRASMTALIWSRVIGPRR